MPHTSRDQLWTRGGRRSLCGPAGGSNAGTAWETSRASSKSTRDDVFALASSKAMVRIIDTIGVKKGYVFFTMDADFWQIPFDEEFFCILQRSGLRRGAVKASNRCRSKAAQREVWQAYRRAEVRGLGGGGGFRKILHCPIILSPPGRCQYGGAHG